jgi:hypothetical protein
MSKPECDTVTRFLDRVVDIYDEAKRAAVTDRRGLSRLGN